MNVGYQTREEEDYSGASRVWEKKPRERNPEIEEIIEEAQKCSNKREFEAYIKRKEEEFLSKFHPSRRSPRKDEYHPGIYEKPRAYSPPQRVSDEQQSGPFPRAIKYCGLGNLPPKQGSTTYYPKRVDQGSHGYSTATARKIPAYIPVTRSGYGAATTPERKRDTSPEGFDHSQFSRAPGEPIQLNQYYPPHQDPIRHEVGPEEGIVNPSPSRATGQERYSPAKAYEPAQPIEYPHSYYPLPKKKDQYAPPQAYQGTGVDYAKLRSMRRGKGPTYAHAMEELGGVEDKLGEMEESLKKNELKALETSQKQWGYNPLVKASQDRDRNANPGVNFGQLRLSQPSADPDYWNYSLQKDIPPQFK